MQRLVAKMIAPLQRQLMLMIARCVVTLVNSKDGMQLLQVELLDGEVRDNVEHFESYGYTSNPPADSEGLFASVAGNRDHGIVVAVGNRKFRLKGLKTGEVAMYTDEGDYIKMARGRNIEVVCGIKVKVTCPDVETSGNLKVGGNLVVDGNISSGADIVAAGNISDAGGAKSMAGMRKAFNDHDHNENNNAGAPTSKPNGSM